MTDAITSPIIASACSNCAAPVTGRYCPECGQKRFAESDRRLKHLLGQFFESLTSLDSRLWRSIRALLLQPGRLSKEYIEGRRARWMPPIALFLMINVAYFFAPPLSDFNLPFSDQVTGDLAIAADPNAAKLTPEQREHRLQIQGQIHSPLTSPWVRARIAERQRKNPSYTTVDYARAYDAESANISKLLIVLHIPFVAAALGVLFYRQRRYYAEHFVVSTHLLTWLLVYALLLIPGLKLLNWLDLAFGLPLKLALAAAPLMYFSVALRRVYASPWWYAAPAALVWFAALTATNVIPYRAIQFVLANWMIGS